MNILENIIAYKRKEVEERKLKFPVKELERSAHFLNPVISLKKALLEDELTGIIAEFKRKSPSKGAINIGASAAEVALGYSRAGATALSILTDTEFFGGTNEDMLAARKATKLPILRKDFIVDEYQIVEAKSIGADVILLLASVLTPNEIKYFATTAKFLGLEVMLEITDKSELRSINILVDCVGVNNRNLKDFKVNVDRSFELAELIPDDFIKISESGLDSAKTIHELKKAGFNGFLVGEAFMKEKNQEAACSALIKSVIEYK